MSYLERIKTEFSENGQHKVLPKPTKAPSVSFVSSASRAFDEKTEISGDDRWNPELASEGYVWCLDCKHFDSVNCNHTDNPFHTVTKCPQAPRKCQWFESSILIY